MKTNPKPASIRNARKNIMGTISFDGLFNGMRKPQDFIVYPMQESGTTIKIQSVSRIGTIDLFNGVVKMSQPHSGGAYFVHLASDAPIWSMLPREDCMTLKQWVKSAAGVLVGDSIVKSDNTGAIAL